VKPSILLGSVGLPAGLLRNRSTTRSLRLLDKLGFGASLIRHDQSQLSPADEGVLVPSTLNAFYQGGFDPATPLTDATHLTQSFTSQLSTPISNYILGFYAQEEWHARSTLSLTLSLRAEHPSNPVCQTRCFARLAGPFESVSHDPDQPYNQAIMVNLKQAFQGLSSIVWAPRFSFAWQPLGVSHNTVLRGGIGIFYDVRYYEKLRKAKRVWGRPGKISKNQISILKGLHETLEREKRDGKHYWDDL
jgi:hypothetical protein